MENSKTNVNKLIIRILIAIICAACVAAGIYSTVQANNYKQEYNEHMKFVNIYERAKDNTSNSLLGDMIISNVKTNAERHQKLAVESQSQMKKFAIISCVLFFVAVMMLISFIATFLNGFTKKKNSTSGEEIEAEN